MKYDKLILMYFSPTGTTKKTIENIAQGVGAKTVEHYDLTDFDKRWQWRSFSKQDLVLIAMPVYEGRLPAPAKEIFNRTKADKTPCIPVVIYGNRAYDDALLELKHKSEACGFKIIAAAAFAAEHSLNSLVATKRPDHKDTEAQIDFGKKIIEKLYNTTDFDTLNVEVPGNYPYKQASDIPLAPSTSERCIKCGKCAEVCPMKAIDPHNPTRTDNFRCIICTKCIKICPNEAREITHPKFILLKNALLTLASGRKEPQVFL